MEQEIRANAGGMGRVEELGHAVVAVRGEVSRVSYVSQPAPRISRKVLVVAECCKLLVAFISISTRRGERCMAVHHGFVKDVHFDIYPFSGCIYGCAISYTAGSGISIHIDSFR